MIYLIFLFLFKFLISFSFNFYFFFKFFFIFFINIISLTSNPRSLILRCFSSPYCFQAILASSTIGYRSPAVNVSKGRVNGRGASTMPVARVPVTDRSILTFKFFFKFLRELILSIFIILLYIPIFSHCSLLYNLLL